MTTKHNAVDQKEKTLERLLLGQLVQFEYRVTIRQYYGIKVKLPHLVIILWLCMRMSLFIGDILGKGKGLRYLQLTIKRFNNTNNSNNNTHIWARVCTDRYKKLLTKQIWWNVKNYRLCSAHSPSPRSGKKTPRNNATCNRGIYY